VSAFDEYNAVLTERDKLQAENIALRECLAEYVGAYPAARKKVEWPNEAPRRHAESREDRAKALLAMQPGFEG
jgi:hypothetical protein